MLRDEGAMTLSTINRDNVVAGIELREGDELRLLNVVESVDAQLALLVCAPAVQFRLADLAGEDFPELETELVALDLLQDAKGVC